MKRWIWAQMKRKKTSMAKHSEFSASAAKKQFYQSTVSMLRAWGHLFARLEWNRVRPARRLFFWTAASRPRVGLAKWGLRNYERD